MSDNIRMSTNPSILPRYRVGSGQPIPGVHKDSIFSQFRLLSTLLHLPLKPIMPTHSLFRYIHLKLLVTLTRLAAFLTGRPGTAKEELRVLDKSVRRLIRIPSRDEHRSIPAWLYTPPNHLPPNDPTSGPKTPVLVNWHGSGFILPSLGGDAGWCDRVARELGIFVVDADYRKAPEDPFPAAVHDVEDVLRWLATQPRFDASRVAVSGFSAGGGLALVAASALRKGLDPVGIPAVLAFYPLTDLDSEPATKTVPRPKKPILPPIARLFNECYVPRGVSRADPRISPSFADGETYPGNVFILTCDGDTLAPEGDALAERLDDRGRRLVHVRLEDAHHGYDKRCLPGSADWKKREDSYELGIGFLKEGLELKK